MSEKSDQSESDKKMQRAFHQVEEHFRHVEDYRRQGSVKHKLVHLIFFTLCAVTAGANDLVGVGTWIEANRAWLKSLLVVQDCFCKFG